MAAVLNPHAVYTGFQQSSFYSPSSYNYSTPPVANSFYGQQQYPVYAKPQPMTTCPHKTRLQQSVGGYPQPQQVPYQPQQPQYQPQQPQYQPQQSQYQPHQPQYQPQQAQYQPQQAPRQSQQASRQPQQAPAYPQPPPLPLRQQKPVRSHHVPRAPPPPPLAPIPEPVPVALQPPTVEYVDADPSTFRRRRPRIIRQVIKLPTPEPIYRQVRRRLPTPEREVIQRTIIKKGNGDVVVRQQQSSRFSSQSRLESNSSRQSTNHRYVFTD